MVENKNNYLTSTEARQSIKEGNDKQEMARCFGITVKILDKLIAGKLRKVPIPRHSIFYEESEGVEEIRDSVKDFIKIELSFGTELNDIQKELKKIFKECIDDNFPKTETG